MRGHARTQGTSHNIMAPRPSGHFDYRVMNNTCTGRVGEQQSQERRKEPELRIQMKISCAKATSKGKGKTPVL